MMKTRAAIMLVAVLVMTLGSAAPASALFGNSSPKTCTFKEFRAVKDGQNKFRVTRILDGAGTRVAFERVLGVPYEIRRYGATTKGNYFCRVEFVGGRVDDKERKRKSGGGSTGGSTSSGDTRASVCTSGEFGQINDGQTKSKVASILDGPGSRVTFTELMGQTYEVRRYGATTDGNWFCLIDFKNGRVDDKDRDQA